MPTAAERLQYLQRHVRAHYATSAAEAVLHCGHCQFPLCRARQVFTVPGAQGTTGAYVNPHGIVHETITVRTLDLAADEGDLWLLGGPEVQDSWFPGYAWTICNCGLCGFHLGWKFDWVGDDEAMTATRPAQFFGLRATQVESKVPRQTIHHHFRAHQSHGNQQQHVSTR